MSITAMKQALEALETLDCGDTYKTHNAAASLRQAIAEAEKQEPVAYGMWDTQLGRGGRMMMVRLDKGQDGCTVPLYSFPPQRQPLTDEQIEALFPEKQADGLAAYWYTFARAIEEAHGIKD